MSEISQYPKSTSSPSAPMGYLAISRPYKGEVIFDKLSAFHGLGSTSEQKPFPLWHITAYSYAYDGDFSQNRVTLTLKLDPEEEDGEIDIKKIGAVPLRYSNHEVRERLERRGKTFWKCRHKQLVSYEGSSTECKYAVRSIFISSSPVLIIVSICLTELTCNRDNDLWLISKHTKSSIQKISTHSKKMAINKRDCPPMTTSPAPLKYICFQL